MSPHDIKATARRIIAQHRAVEDAVAAVPLKSASFDNVVVPIANINARLAAALNNILFYKSVSAVKAKRDASIEAKKLPVVSIRLRRVCALSTRGPRFSLPLSCIRRT